MREGDDVTRSALFTNTVWWKNLRDGATVTVSSKGTSTLAWPMWSKTLMLWPRVHW